MSLQELKDNLAKDLFGETSTEAQNIDHCICCNQPIFQGSKGDGPGCIYSSEGNREYRISGICEHCFDSMWEE